MVCPPELFLRVERLPKHFPAAEPVFSLLLLDRNHEPFEFLLHRREILHELGGLLPHEFKAFAKFRRGIRLHLVGRSNVRNLCVDLVALPLKLRNTRCGIRRGVVNDLLQCAEDELQARFGHDQRALAQGINPAEHALRLRCQLVVRVVPVIRVVAVQIAAVCPLSEIHFRSRPHRIGLFRPTFVEVVLQEHPQRRSRNRNLSALTERELEEMEYIGCVLRPQ